MAGRSPAVSFSTSLQNISSPFPLLFGMIEKDTAKVIWQTAEKDFYYGNQFILYRMYFKKAGRENPGTCISGGDKECVYEGTLLIDCKCTGECDNACDCGGYPGIDSEVF